MNIFKSALFSVFLFTTPTFANHNAVVLMYHTITQKTSDMNTKPDNFQNQIDYLHKNNFNVISSIDLIDAIKEKKTLPSKTVVFTFDDGWASQKTAMAKLNEYNYPATFALVTQYQMIKNHTYLQKADLDRYSNFTYVNHSHTHFKKDFLNNSEKDVEISKSQIIQTTGKFVPIYVYPYGAKNAGLIKAIQKNGYIAAFGVGSGLVNTQKTNILYIHRYLINDKVTLDKFKSIVNQTI